MSGPFTGRHMTAILVGFFAVVITVNLAMARYAVGTFGGVVVENSYVASQHFNRWLDESASEQALGWRAEAARAEGNRIGLELIGPEGGDTTVSAIARHPLGRQPDRALTFVPAGRDRYVSREALPEGRWRLRLEVAAQGRSWRSERDLF